MVRLLILNTVVDMVGFRSTIIHFLSIFSIFDPLVTCLVTFELFDLFIFSISFQLIYQVFGLFSLCYFLVLALGLQCRYLIIHSLVEVSISPLQVEWRNTRIIRSLFPPPSYYSCIYHLYIH